MESLEFPLGWIRRVSTFSPLLLPPQESADWIQWGKMRDCFEQCIPVTCLWLGIWFFRVYTLLFGFPLLVAEIGEVLFLSLMVLDLIQWYDFVPFIYWLSPYGGCNPCPVLSSTNGRKCSWEKRKFIIRFFILHIQFL